jgi:hypothetical protein
MLIAAKIGLALAGTIVAGGAYVCSDGFLHVSVDESGRGGNPPQHISVTAPAMIVPMVVRVVTHFARDGEHRHKMAEASRKMQPWMPTIETAVSELKFTDDMTLVDVYEPDSHVRVAKSGGSIVIDVEDKDDVVHVSAPLRAISGTVEELASAIDSNDSYSQQ